MTGPGALIAVTGGTGSLGRVFVARALAEGWRLRLLTRDPEGVRRPDVEGARFDLLSDEPIDPAVLAGCDAVVHLAAHIPADKEDPGEAARCLHGNALGTVRLLTAMEEAGVARFLHATAANCYSPGADRPTEDSPMFPAHRAPFYLASKLVQDIFAEHWSLRRGIAVATLRVSSLYGAGQSAGAITRMAASLARGEKVTLANGGRFAADFVTLADVADAFLLFLRQGTSGIFNIGSGRRSTIAEVAELLAGIVGAAPGSIVVEPAAGPAEPGFPPLDVTRALDHGFRPSPLEQGLRELATWLGARPPLDV